MYHCSHPFFRRIRFERNYERFDDLLPALLLKFFMLHCVAVTIDILLLFLRKGESHNS